MKKIKRVIILLIICFVCSGFVAYGENDEEKDIEYYIEESNKVVDYESLQKTIDQLEIQQGSENVEFKQLVDEIIAGNYDMSITNLLATAGKTLFEEVFLHVNIMVQIVVVVIIIAIFSNFTSAFNGKYTGEIAFFITYLILASLIIQTFQVVSVLSVETINNVLIFMKVLIPSYLATVGLTGSVSSVFVLYETVFIIIAFIEWVIITFIIPFINIIVILEIANNITEESMLSKLTENLRGLVGWVLKGMVICFFGLNLIQSLALPAIDTVANKSVKNAIDVIPVVGSGIKGATEMIMGSAYLIKNAVGVGGIVILLLICLIPLIKIIAFLLIYKGIASLIQPISNSRIVDCLTGVGESTKLLLGAVFSVGILFIITIALITLTTNLSYVA